MGIQFMGYVNIPDVLQEFYGISTFFIIWTMLIYTVALIILVLPLQTFIKNKSVRFLVLVPSGMHVISCLLKPGFLKIRFFQKKKIGPSRKTPNSVQFIRTYLR